MWRYIILWICWIPICLCSVCPVGTGPVFISENNSPFLDRGVRCFEYCAEQNCIGVLSQSTFCIALNVHNNSGYLNENDITRKHCLKDVIAPTVVSSFKDKILNDYTKKIEHINDRYHCLSKCINEKSFPCSSTMYYDGRKDCLMISNTTEIKNKSYDSGDLTGYYMQMMALSDNRECATSFRQINWNDLEIKGEAKLYNGSEGLNKCISYCVDCDFVLFTEAYSECFIVQYNPLGQHMEFLSEEYQVLESLCHHPAVECSVKNSMYILYRGEDEIFKKRCLNSCLADDTCMFVYKQDDKCLTTTTARQLPVIIERKCTENDDMNFAILYEETPTCMTGEALLEQGGLDLEACMFLCATHPTKSCESISFSSGICILLNDVAQLKNSSSTCQHFTLNIISYERDSIGFEMRNEPNTILTGETKGIPKKKMSRNENKTSIEKVNLSGKKKKTKINGKSVKKYGGANITVETICNYKDVVVKISSREPIYGELFPRNGHKICSIAMEGKNMTELRLPLNGTHCAMTRDGFIYHTVIVVKQNNMNSIPIITENDGLYKISCDYSNQTANITAKRALRLRDSEFRNVTLRGSIPYDTTVKMELRSKREEMLKSVVIGQHIDLVFHAQQHPTMGYYIRNCQASSKDNFEKISLIEEGCATKTAKEYIIRKEIKKNRKGFTIPLRAFKFKHGDEVKITCKLDFCKTCEQPTCGKDVIRHRRYLFTQTDSEDVHALMVVNEAHGSEGFFCIARISLVTVIMTGTYIMLFLIYILIRIIRRRAKV